MDKAKNRKQKWETRKPQGGEIFVEKEASYETRPRKNDQKKRMRFFGLNLENLKELAVKSKNLRIRIYRIR